MAADAGMILLTFPNNGAATDAANSAVTNVTTTGDKAFFWFPTPMDVVEVGAVIGTVTAATTYVFTVASAPNTGGAFTVFATVTGPASTAIASGSRLKKDLGVKRLNAGDVLRFSVTGAPASGTAQFYAILYPAGDPATGSEIVVSST